MRVTRPEDRHEPENGGRDQVRPSRTPRCSPRRRPSRPRTARSGPGTAVLGVGTTSDSPYTDPVEENSIRGPRRAASLRARCGSRPRSVRGPAGGVPPESDVGVGGEVHDRVGAAHQLDQPLPPSNRSHSTDSKRGASRPPRGLPDPVEKLSTASTRAPRRAARRRGSTDEPAPPVTTTFIGEPYEIAPRPIDAGRTLCRRVVW